MLVIFFWWLKKGTSPRKETTSFPPPSFSFRFHRCSTTNYSGLARKNLAVLLKNHKKTYIRGLVLRKVGETPSKLEVFSFKDYPNLNMQVRKLNIRLLSQSSDFTKKNTIIPQPFLGERSSRLVEKVCYRSILKTIHHQPHPSRNTPRVPPNKKNWPKTTQRRDTCILGAKPEKKTRGYFCSILCSQACRFFGYPVVKY